MCTSILTTGICSTFSTRRLACRPLRGRRRSVWKEVLRQYHYTIIQIAGNRNCLGNSLSRWVTVPSVSARASAVYAVSEPDEALSSKQAIQEVQQASRANLGTLAAGATSFITDDGQVTLDDEGLFPLSG